jgi:hypothetical protein
MSVVVDFSSSSLLTKRGTQGEFLQFFNLFYYTIISETISDIELQQLLPILRKSTTTLIRKNDQPINSSLSSSILDSLEIQSFT